MDDGPFCDIIEDAAPTTFLRRWADAVAIAPLNPVTEGHDVTRRDGDGLTLPWTGG